MKLLQLFSLVPSPYENYLIHKYVIIGNILSNRNFYCLLIMIAICNLWNTMQWKTYLYFWLLRWVLHKLMYSVCVPTSVAFCFEACWTKLMREPSFQIFKFSLYRNKQWNCCTIYLVFITVAINFIVKQ